MGSADTATIDPPLCLFCPFCGGTGSMLATTTRLKPNSYAPYAHIFGWPSNRHSALFLRHVTMNRALTHPDQNPCSPSAGPRPRLLHQLHVRSPLPLIGQRFVMSGQCELVSCWYPWFRAPSSNHTARLADSRSGGMVQQLEVVNLGSYVPSPLPTLLVAIMIS